jgi:transcriptional regulator with XRE-family HTH domain
MVINSKKISTRVSPDSILIGATLRALREAAGLTQHDIAVILKVAFQQVQKYETGRNRLPIEKMFVLKHFYAVPYEKFFENLRPPRFKG